MAEEAKWYVIHTYSGYEMKVADSIRQAVKNRNMQELIPKVNIPTETVIEYKKVKKPVKDPETGKIKKDPDTGKPITEELTEPREVQRKIFPGYVLVKMVLNDDTWYLVRNTRGCTGFVGQNKGLLGQDKSSGSDPIPLTEEEIISMGVEKREYVVDYAEGDSVRIMTGSLENFIGTVSMLDVNKNKVSVIVSMMGRDTPIEFQLDQVEKVQMS